MHAAAVSRECGSEAAREPCTIALPSTSESNLEQTAFHPHGFVPFCAIFVPRNFRQRLVIGSGKRLSELDTNALFSHGLETAGNE